MAVKDQLSEAAKSAVKAKAKAVGKKVLIKYILPYVVVPILVIVIIAGAFMIITGAIKDAADKVVSTTSSVFSSTFDNTSDNPEVKVSDDMIKSVMYELQNNQSIDVNATYLTDKLLKNSIEAYYATQYPYIDGVDYDNDDIVKGCIYLKRGNTDLKYTNYNNFSSMLGTEKSASDVESVKKYFSMDNEDNIVVATWTANSYYTQTINEDTIIPGTVKYDDEGSEQPTYDITEYKIDQRSLTQQFAMNYKLPILLANLYSNEGFGIAVANLAKNARIELSILDDITTTVTETKEYFKMNYKADGTFDWKMADDGEENDGKNGKINESISGLAQWEKDYTTEDRMYKLTRNTEETNDITVKITDVETWICKGTITDVSSDTDISVDGPNENMIENNPSDWTSDGTQTFDYAKLQGENFEITSGLQKNELLNKIVDVVYSKDGVLITQNDVRRVALNISKKMSDHKITTIVTTTTTTYTSSDMELVDNTDSFLALIRSDSNGEYTQNMKYKNEKDGGKLVNYIIKSAADDIEIDDDYVPSLANDSNASYTSTNGWTQYYQGDFANVSYGSSNLAKCGCGPTSFSMVATHLSGKTISPKDAVSWCGNNYYVSGAGTSWIYFAAAAKHFKLNCNVKQTSSISEAVNALKKGYPVISSQGPGLFTKKGHFIVLAGIDNGKITVLDPNKNNAVNKNYNNRTFSSSEISAAGKQYWIFEPK